MWEKDNFGTSELGGKPLLDSLVLTFLEHINKLLGVGLLVRTRRAVLMNAKVNDLSYGDSQYISLLFHQ